MDWLRKFGPWLCGLSTALGVTIAFLGGEPAQLYGIALLWVPIAMLLLAPLSNNESRQRMPARVRNGRSAE